MPKTRALGVVYISGALLFLFMSLALSGNNALSNFLYGYRDLLPSWIFSLFIGSSVTGYVMMLFVYLVPLYIWLGSKMMFHPESVEEIQRVYLERKDRAKEAVATGKTLPKQKTNRSLVRILIALVMVASYLIITLMFQGASMSFLALGYIALLLLVMEAIVLIASYVFFLQKRLEVPAREGEGVAETESFSDILIRRLRQFFLLFLTITIFVTVLEMTTAAAERKGFDELRQQRVQEKQKNSVRNTGYGQTEPKKTQNQ